jgi:enoyl-CoA hydratase
MPTWVRTQSEDGVGVLAIDRPEASNAIDLQILWELEESFLALERQPEVRAVVITGGNEKAFSAGGDIRAMRDMTVGEGRRFVEAGHRVMDRIEQSRLVTIAAINGVALGGGAELALACDIRVAAEGARLGFPEVTLGLYPGWGGTQRAARLLGPGKAKLLILTGKTVGAAEAERLGLVEVTASPASLMENALSIARRVAGASPSAVSQAKTAIVHGGEEPLRYGLRLEIEGWMVNFAHPDRVEGLTAFLERRPPRWEGL